jgi:hypothetical protein
MQKLGGDERVPFVGYERLGYGWAGCSKRHRLTDKCGFLLEDPCTGRFELVV